MINFCMVEGEVIVNACSKGLGVYYEVPSIEKSELQLLIEEGRKMFL